MDRPPFFAKSIAYDVSRPLIGAPSGRRTPMTAHAQMMTLLSGVPDNTRA